MSRASKLKHKENKDFDRLLKDADCGRINRKLSAAYTRPIYYGTRLQREVEDAKNKEEA